MANTCQAYHIFAIDTRSVLCSLFLSTLAQVLVGTAYSLVQDLPREHNACFEKLGAMSLGSTLRIRCLYTNPWFPLVSTFWLAFAFWQHVATHALVAICQLWKESDSKDLKGGFLNCFMITPSFRSSLDYKQKTYAFRPAWLMIERDWNILTHTIWHILKHVETNVSLSPVFSLSWDRCLSKAEEIQSAAVDLAEKAHHQKLLF